MTGYDVLKRASGLLGASGAADAGADGKLAVMEGLEIINQLAADLKIDGLSSISGELDIPAAKAEALCYGAAMLLALNAGDAGKNRIFAEIYNAKRGTALAEKASITDRLPTVTVG